MIFWRLDPVTATSFSLANKEFQAIFEDLAPNVFGQDYTFPLEIDTVIRCDDKWKTQVSLKATLMGWFSPAGPVLGSLQKQVRRGADVEGYL